MATHRIKRRGCHGMVTAETAVVLPFLVAFTFLLLWIIGLGITQVRLTDASQQAARAVARGDSAADAKAAARSIASSDVKVSVNSEHGYVTVVVSADTHPPLLPSVGSQRLSSETVAALEPHIHENDE